MAFKMHVLLAQAKQKDRKPAPVTYPFEFEGIVLFPTSGFEGPGM